MDNRIIDDERAVSELIGEIMLIGIVLIAFGMIAVSVHSYISKSPDAPHIDVAGRCDIDSDRVYLKHQGGETVDKKDLRILVRVNGSTTEFENYEGLWALGNVINLSVGNITQNDAVRVAIVHVPSGRVLSSGEVAEGTFGSASTNIAPTADAGEDQRNDLCDDTGILEVTFDGSGSYDPDGSITRYDWDFGDGNTSGGTGASASATYASPDTYTVTLTVTDSDGATASDTCAVTIDPAAPLCANAGPDRWVALGAAVELNGSGSTGCIKGWHWDLGDGNTSGNEVVTHTYGSTGIYNVTLTVEDYSDCEDEDAATVEVLNETVRVTNPQDGDVVSGTVSVDAHVFGIPESGINRVEFFSDLKLIGTDSDGDTAGNNTLLYSIAWNTTDWTACADAYEGVRTIYAIVYYGGNASKSQDVVVEVANDALPVITITAPEASDYVNNVTAVRAIVTDDQNVTNVTLLVNGAFRGIMTPPNSFDRNWGYRVPVTIHAGGSDWNDTPVARTINFTEELVSLGGSGTIDMNSVRVIEKCENGTFVCEVPSQVEWNESGDVAWIINGSLPAGSERYYSVYFDTLENGAKDDPGYAWFNSTASGYPSATDGNAEIAYPYYTYQWNTSLELEGATSVAANATDDSCPVNQSNESAITAYVDNVPDPAIEIDSHDADDNVTGTVNITTVIYNILPEDATNVEFYVMPEIVNRGWNSIGNDTTPAFTHLWDTTYWQAGYGDWEWIANSTGKYYLRAHLADRYNQTAKSDRNFYLWVENQPPAVNITTPANGSTVEGDVNVTADVTDNGHVVPPVAYNITNVTGSVVASESMTCDWWNTSWSRRKPITITSASALSDYQINLTVDYESEIAPDFDDLRFASDDGSELPYWIENKTDNVSADLWINVSSIPAGESTIYMYYGNDAASSASSGEETFDLFDDFDGTSLDTDRWSATGSYSVDNDIRINTGSVYTDSTIAATPENRTFEMRARYHTHASSYSGIMIADVPGTGGGNEPGDAGSYLMTASNNTSYMQMWGGDGTEDRYNIVSGTTLYNNIALDTDYIIGFSFTGSAISYFMKNLAYTDIARSDRAGTWNRPFYLWLGYFTGSSAGSANIDDVTVEWVRVRRYADQTPTATIGSEESGGSVVCHTTWNTSALPSGNYTICISANDNANQTSANCTSVYLHNPPPSVNITTPANGSTVTGAVTIAADVTDNGYVVPPVTYEIADENKSVVENGSMGRWSRRKPITITSSTLLSNYQIDLTIDYESEMQFDFDDIRFFGENGSELPYWIEEKTDGVSATIWVNVSSIPAGNSTILMYYGNAVAESGSDFDSTFAKDFGELGLIGLWHFDEGSGNPGDSSGNGSNGTRNGTTWAGADGGQWGGRSDVVFGTGDSLVFDENDDYIDCGDGFTSITTAITAEFWMKSGDASKSGTPISYATTHDANEFLIYNYRNFGIYRGGGHVTTGISVNDGYWHHIVVTWRSSGGETKLYKDGDLAYSGMLQSGQPINHGTAQSLVIGSEQDSVGGGFDTSQAFLGMLDEVRIYNRVLGEEEVYRHYIRSRCASTPPDTIIGLEEGVNLYMTSWNTPSLPGGNYTITVSAEDDSGQGNTSCVSVRLSPDETAESTPAKSGGTTGIWHFDENDEKRAADSLGNGNDGNIGGAEWTTGVNGSALQFDGDDDCIIVPDSENLNPLDEITIEAWANVREHKTAKVVDKGDLEGYDIALDKEGWKGGVCIDGKKYDVTWSGEEPDHDQWYYLVLTYDGSAVTLYVDGVKEDTTPASGGLKGNTNDLSIGSTGGTDKFFNGVIDEVAIHDRALTADEILERYEENKPDGRVGFWRFDEGAEYKAADSSGNGNDGKIDLDHVKWVEGVSKSALYFGGKGHVEIPDSDTLEPTDAITLDAWVKWEIDPAKGDPWANIINKNGDDQYQLRHSKDNARFEVAIQTDSDKLCVQSKTQPKAGVWYHVVGTYDGFSVYIYVNGELENSGSMSGSMKTSESPVNIGRRIDGDCHFNGVIDEVVIYDYALSSDEVSERYKESRGSETSDDAEISPTAVATSTRERRLKEPARPAL